jgi:transposase-like protein
VKLVASDPTSLYQWNEGAGEYEVVCPRCSAELFAPTLGTMRDSYLSHYKTKECKAHY